MNHFDPEKSIELVKRAKDGDEDALNRLLTRHRPRIRRWCSGRLPAYARDFTDTEDIVQEALIGLMANLSTFKYEGEWSVQAYLRRAAINRMRNELRKNRPGRGELHDDLSSKELNPYEVAVGQEAFGRYLAALETLTPMEQEAVVGRVEMGFSMKEMMALLERPSEDAARMFVSRALEKLSKDMAVRMNGSAPRGDSV